MPASTALPCHQIEAATTDGNGSYTLVTHSLLLPQDSDPQSLPKHRDQMGSAKTLGNQLCVSCHRGFCHQSLAMIFLFQRWKIGNPLGIPVTIDTKPRVSIYPPLKTMYLLSYAAQKR